MSHFSFHETDFQSSKPLHWSFIPFINIYLKLSPQFSTSVFILPHILQYKTVHRYQ